MGFLADLVVFVHLLYIAFVVGGEVAVLAGAALQWRWVRNPAFRLAHALAIVAVAAGAALGLPCPLTRLEAALRRRAGAAAEPEISFVGRLLRDLVYVDVPPGALAAVYIGFAVVVVATMLLVPPRFGGRAAPRLR